MREPDQFPDETKLDKWARLATSARAVAGATLAGVGFLIYLSTAAISLTNQVQQASTEAGALEKRVEVLEQNQIPTATAFATLMERTDSAVKGIDKLNTTVNNLYALLFNRQIIDPTLKNHADLEPPESPSMLNR